MRFFKRKKFNYSLSINGFLTHHFEKYTQGQVKNDDMKNGDFCCCFFFLGGGGLVMVIH